MNNFHVQNGSAYAVYQLIGMLILASTLSASTLSADDELRNETIFQRLQGRQIAAHRGGMFGKGNTLEQFAHDLGENASSILEMDLRISADGVPVVFHDNTLDNSSIGCFARPICCEKLNSNKFYLN